MNAVLIDDDTLNNELLENLLGKYCPNVNIVGIAEDVEEALAVIVNTDPDVIFLDIELHNLTARDLLNAIDLENRQVVIISAYEKYALQMHKYPVTDYLLKPLIITDLIVAVNKVQKQYEKIKGLNNGDDDSINKYIALPEKDHMNITNIEMIMRLEASGNYTKIHTVNSKCIISSKTLGEYEDFLPKQKFLRVHNSHIVNLQFVSKYLRTKNGCLVLTDGTEVPISANRKKGVTTRIVF